MSHKKTFATRAIRGSHYRSQYREHSPALHLTSSFTFESAAQAADIFAEREQAFQYSRFGNPTVQAFEERMADLEGGARGTATSTGMSAVLTLALATLVELTDLDDWRAAMRPNTRLLFLESPSNPLLAIGDIAAIADIAHAGGAKLAVDNCFATAVLQRPLELGADYSVHSATKYLDGQGRALGGIIISKAEEDGTALYQLMRGIGTGLGAFEAWLYLKSLETLALRVRAHSENALHVARWLEAQPAVARVYYPGLESHPQHALAARQMHGGFGGMVSFDVKGGKDAAWHLIDHCDWLSNTGNLGDTRTIITHPDSTTHSRVDAAEKARIGLGDGAIRLSVGLEDADDICAALAQGLKN